jgi:hypothetical protein
MQKEQSAPAPLDKIAALAVPFADGELKKRTVLWDGASKEISYVPSGRVVQRLNAVLGFDWEFTILDLRVEGDFVKVRAKLSVHLEDGRTCSREGVGAQQVFSSKNGRCSYADDEAAAMTYALKHCARLFGVGNDLYFEEREKGALDAANEAARQATGLPDVDKDGPVTQQQIDAFTQRLATLPNRAAKDQAFAQNEPSKLTAGQMASLLVDDDYWISLGAKAKGVRP